MLQILRLQGTEDQLYRLVAPLVMDPKVLKQNYHFPFRTSERFEWFVAVEKKRRQSEVVGFVPVENKRSELVINNYYTKDKDKDLLKTLLCQFLDTVSKRDVAAISFREDMDVFAGFGFVEEKQWTRYVKMRKPYTKHEASEEEERL